LGCTLENWAERKEEEKVYFSSPNFKTGQTISLNFSNRAFYLPRAVLKAV
jgi:hypothetical protein